MPDTPDSGLTPELKVTLFFGVFGLLGGVAIFFLDFPPIIVAVFLATGVSSLVYGFLGGIQTSTFGLGPIKFGGSIAALLGSSWFINGQLADQMQVNLGQISPPVATLLAIDVMRGVPTSVDVAGLAGAIPLPPPGALANNQVDIQHLANEFVVVSETDPNFVLGTLGTQDFQRVGLFNVVEPQVEGFYVTGLLTPNLENVELGRLPFTLSTRNYASEYSGYVLRDAAGQVVHEGGIYRRQAEIVAHDGKSFVVGEVRLDIVP